MDLYDIVSSDTLNMYYNLHIMWRRWESSIWRAPHISTKSWEVVKSLGLGPGFAATIGILFLYFPTPLDRSYNYKL